jgi:aspartate aminotransferase
MFDEDVISFAHGDGLRRPAPSTLSLIRDDMLATGKYSVDRYQYREPVELLIDTLLSKQREWYRTSFDSCAFGPGVTGLFYALVQALDLSRSSLIASPGFYHGWVSWAEACKLDFHPESPGSDCICQPDRLVHSLRLRERPVLLLANPNYLGQSLTRDAAEALANCIVDSRALLVEDAIFARDRHVPGDGHYICEFLPADYPCCLVDSGSKSFGIANARAGWLLGPRSIVSRVREFLDITGPSFSYFSQMSLLRSIEHSSEYLSMNQAELGFRRRVVHEMVRSVNDDLSEEFVSLPFHDGASHSTAIALAFDGRLADPLLCSRFLLERSQVACPPGASHGLATSALRLNYGCVGSSAGHGSRGSFEPTETTAESQLAAEDFAPGRKVLEEGIARLRAGLLGLHHHLTNRRRRGVAATLRD